MNKEEIERLLIEQSGADALRQRAQALAGELETGVAQDPTAVRRVEGAQATQLTPTEIQRNYRTFVDQPLLAGSLSRFIPDLHDKSPTEALEALLSEHLAEPSTQTAVLVEDAVNRLTTAGELDASALTVVNRVFDAFKERPPKKRRRGDRSATGFEDDDIWLMSYDHADFRGPALFTYMPRGETYKRVRVGTLAFVGLQDKISSFKVATSPDEVGGYVILFDDDRFIGKYVSWQVVPGSVVDINYVGNFINDLTSSILVVRRFPDELRPVNLGSYVSKSDIKAILESHPKLSARGDPVLTWDMWPEGPTSGADPRPNEPSKTYVFVKVPVTVHVPYWFDYDAEIRYWIYLYVADDGKLQGFTDYYGAWVESGIIHDQVLGGLMNEIPNTLGDVQSKLTTALTVANVFGPYAHVYYLPGMNQGAAGAGYTTDDVSIVLARRPLRYAHPPPSQ